MKGDKTKSFGVSLKAVVLNEEGKILTLFRTETAPSRPSTWDLPGGDLDFGEEPEKSILREIKEETGLDVQDIVIFDSEAHINQEGVHWVTLAYKCVALSEDVVLSFEHNNYRWVTQDEFLRLESSPKLQQFVKSTKK